MAQGRIPGVTNPMPGAPNPLGAGSLAYGGARAVGMGKGEKVTRNLPKRAARSLYGDFSPQISEDVDARERRLLPDLIRGGPARRCRTRRRARTMGDPPGPGRSRRRRPGGLRPGTPRRQPGRRPGSPAARQPGSRRRGRDRGGAEPPGRHRWNEDVTDLMRRLPPGATYRDYLTEEGRGHADDRLQDLRAMRYIARDLADGGERASLSPALIDNTGVAMAAPGPVADLPCPRAPTDLLPGRHLAVGRGRAGQGVRHLAVRPAGVHHPRSLQGKAPGFVGPCQGRRPP
jgi:hypothetical protein